MTNLLHSEQHYLSGVAMKIKSYDRTQQMEGLSANIIRIALENEYFMSKHSFQWEKANLNPCSRMEKGQC